MINRLMGIIPKVSCCAHAKRYGCPSAIDASVTTAEALRRPLTGLPRLDLPTYKRGKQGRIQSRQSGIEEKTLTVTARSSAARRCVMGGWGD